LTLVVPKKGDVKAKRISLKTLKQGIEEIKGKVKEKLKA